MRPNRFARIAHGQVELHDVDVAANPAADATTHAATDADPQAWATAVAALTGACDLVMAAPTAGCLCATLNDEPHNRHWREALIYALEQYLPMAAEDMTADFALTGAPGGAETRVLGVATPWAGLRPWIDALGQRDIHAAHICPFPLLVLDHLRSQGLPPDTAAVVVREPAGLSLLQLTDGRLTDWHWLPGGPEDVRARLALLPAALGPALAVGCSASDREILATHLNPHPLQHVEDETHPQQDQALRHAARSAQRLLHGRQRPMIDLARGPLAPRGSTSGLRRAAGITAAAAAAFLLCANLGLWWRCQRLNQVIEQERQEQRAAYAHALGHEAPTAQIAWRMESEFLALTRQPAPGPTRPQEISALSLAWQILMQAPPQTPMRWKSIHLERGKATIDGSASSHEAAAAFAAVLRGSTPLIVDPPRTSTNANQSVTFHLEAHWPSDGESAGDAIP
jgi:hypothetical protein